MPTAAQNAANSADRIATACKETHPMFERIPHIRPQLTWHRPVGRRGCRLEQTRRPATDADWSSTALTSANAVLQLDVREGVPGKGTDELTQQPMTCTRRSHG